ncbi:hypothetical protein ACA910_012914 [Epithemia clementina (nom. ined.)]
MDGAPSYAALGKNQGSVVSGIVPVWIAGKGRRQIGARTLRPRIHRAIGKYLQDFPTLEKVYQPPSPAKMEMPEFD